MDDPLRFDGGVFSDEIEGGRGGAEIELESTEIRARVVQGRQFSLPYHRCHLEMGGASGRMVFCRNEDRSLTIFCEDRRFPRALEAVSGGLLTEPLEELLQRRRREGRRGRALALAVLLSISGLLVGGYYGIIAAARGAVEALPISVDREMGEQAMKAMGLEGERVTDPEVVSSIRSMIERIEPQVATEGFEFTLQIIDGPTLNAFALPGGPMVIYTGLLEKAEGPEEIAGVLAHEMAHVTLRHGLKQLGQSVGVYVGISLLVGDASGLVELGAGLLATSAVHGYSREQEAEADAEAVRMLQGAGIDPMALARLLGMLGEEVGDAPQLLSWVSSHPRHQERVEAIRRKVEKSPGRQYKPLELDWPQVLERLPGREGGG